MSGAGNAVLVEVEEESEERRITGARKYSWWTGSPGSSPGPALGQAVYISEHPLLPT